MKIINFRSFCEIGVGCIFIDFVIVRVIKGYLFVVVVFNRSDCGILIFSFFEFKMKIMFC